MAEGVCQCATFRNVRIPLHRNHPCDRTIDKKSVLCRPCAMNWHDGPCDTYYREPLWWIVKTCARCGHDSALHPARGENEKPHTSEELSGRFRHLIGEINAPRDIEVNEWTKMSQKEFRDEGILYAVNQFVLWPLGLAIGVDPKSEDPAAPGVQLMALAEAETIIGGDFDLAKEPCNEHPLTRFIAYAKARVEAMPNEGEKAVARERLAVIIPDILG